MSKFLLNLLQISKALVYSKINFLFGKKFSFTFGPIGPAASRPSRDPLGLCLSADPAHRLGPADRALMAPCPIAASHLRKCISRKPPSLHECVLRRKSATSARPISAGPSTTPPPTTGLGLPAGPNRPAHLASQRARPARAFGVLTHRDEPIYSAIEATPPSPAITPDPIKGQLHP
jgi:hypothetical protein